MGYAKSCVVALGTVLGVMAGCGTDDEEPGNDAGAGNAGSAGTAGRTGGSSGRGGAGANAGGRAGGDSGGRAGSGGRGGSGGAGSGGAGEGGQAGGGEGGACLEEVDHHPLGAACGDGDQATVSTSCTFEDTCKALGCGEPFSQFDASGCRREECASSEDCADDERCVSARVRGDTECHSSLFEDCGVSECNVCVCGGTDDCRSLAFCLPADEYPADEDCDLAGLGCDDLVEWSNYLKYADRLFEGDTKAAIEACRSKVDQAVDDCSGDGGSGAGGQSGAGGEGGGAGQSAAGGQAGGGGAPGG